MRTKVVLYLALVLSGVMVGCSHTQPADTASASGGSEPLGGLALSGHTLFGTTSASGDGFWNCGTVFKINTDGRGFTILHNFSPAVSPASTNGDGIFPRARLVLSGDTLYGTALEGGKAGGGTVFKVKTDGRDFTTLHHFENFYGLTNDGGTRPMAGVILSDNTLYGTTQRGGVNEGTVYKVNTDGSGFAVLHTFTRMSGPDFTNSDGAFPQTKLALAGRTLYGAGWSGGAGGVGTIFAVNTDGSGFKVLHNFARQVIDHSRNTGHALNSDGADLESGLVLSGDQLYGTASEGGSEGTGTVFKIKTDGTGFTLLHVFSAIGIAYPQITNGDGGHPGDLILSGNTLYGSTSEGGLRGGGTVFKINADGTGFATLPVFAGTVTAGPAASFMLAGKEFYGTTAYGGKGGGGTVFKADVKGGELTVLHSFIRKPLPGWLTD